LYYKPKGEDTDDEMLKRLIDEQYTATPFYGSRKIEAWFKTKNYVVNRKRVVRLMREMGIEAIYQKPKVSQSAPGHKIYPLSSQRDENHQTESGMEH